MKSLDCHYLFWHLITISWQQGVVTLLTECQLCKHWWTLQDLISEKCCIVVILLSEMNNT